ncbi:TolC family protein [Sphingomonas sp. TDK1]|jgi:outer membrane protein TolC|uniref:TolC family protein n=1 Tax=Sphingomonas sp. TDK1 TaxID=453247 RepID=UPI0007D94384|nr:TolC family protein [Sphingomonas sp. TDK1]OAN64891.1 multidrug transporter [Sphingomonas sp. TDK1]
MIGRVLIALCLLWPGLAWAQAPRPLMLDEVLRSSAAFAPQIVEALARERQAQGRALTAQGAFDTVFEGDAQSRVAGYYDGSYAEGRATRPLTGNGGQLYGAYRLSRGTFPIYEDKAYTSRLGELRVGGLFSLLRDRAIDERRGRDVLARSDVDVARLEREMVAIGVQGRAIAAYQNWAAAGLRLKAYRSLLALAEDRRGGIGRQVELGARPEILLTENEQNIVRRRALVVRTEQEFAAAANALSLFLRDSEGERVTPMDDRLPGELPGFSAPRPAGPVTRPDLSVASARIEQSQVRLALAENELKPRLDARGELAYGAGGDGLGGPSRSGGQAIVGLRFSVPLQRRQAKGRIAEARAEIDALRARQRLIGDQIAVEVRGIVIAADGAEKTAELAAREAELADRMAIAERRRFQLGASDFFVLNLREEAATDARVRLLDAQARAALAAADLAQATADRTRLGLGDVELP